MSVIAAQFPHPASGVRTTVSSSTTILLVEDETFVRNVAGEILEGAGFQVIRVRSSAEAMRAFQACGGRIDLLLTDVVLPGRNGKELAQDLKAFRPGLKTIFISGYPFSIVSPDKRLPLGVSYLAKPFSMESLMQAVNTALD